MLKVLTVVLCGVAAGLLAPTVAWARDNTLSEVYLLPDLFDIMAQEGRRATLSDPAVPEDAVGRAGWVRAVERIYDAELMHSDFIGALEKVLDPEVRTEALAFAQTDLGRRVLQLEVSARRALLSDEIDEIARSSLDAARDAPENSAQARALALVRERIAANDLIELNVLLGLNTSLAYYDGMADAGWTSGLAGADLLTLVWAQEEAIRRDATEWAESYFLMAYQPLTEPEMAGYLDHATSAAGDAFNTAMFQAFDEVFVNISRRVGVAMAKQMQEETL